MDTDFHDFPLVSVCIPTYNRPLGLQRTLERIVNQTYKNLEIIVSDNCSEDPEVKKVAEKFQAHDSRIKFFRQPQNLGARGNFEFLLNNLTGQYFMWAADDDYLESNNLIENLLPFCADHILVFPDCRLGFADQVSNAIFREAYGNCQTSFEYIKAWCNNGQGYPFYGIYNLEEVRASNLQFKFNNELAYYNEGEFLHEIFLCGKVKFVPDVFIVFDTSNSIKERDFLTLIKSFVSYTKNVFCIYMQTQKINPIQKTIILYTILKIHCEYLLMLFVGIWSSQLVKQTDLIRYSLSNLCVPLLLFIGFLFKFSPSKK